MISEELDSLSIFKILLVCFHSTNLLLTFVINLLQVHIQLMSHCNFSRNLRQKILTWWFVTLFLFTLYYSQKKIDSQEHKSILKSSIIKVKTH